jgi:hypothetical protein
MVFRSSLGLYWNLQNGDVNYFVKTIEECRLIARRKLRNRILQRFVQMCTPTVGIKPTQHGQANERHSRLFGRPNQGRYWKGNALKYSV